MYPEPEFHVVTINADSIAYDGGVLNCCTWNITMPIKENVIDNLTPIVGDINEMLIIKSDDLINKDNRDVLCFRVTINAKKYDSPWSLMRMEKFGNGEKHITDIEEIKTIKMKLIETFTPIELTEMFQKLETPTIEALNSLVQII